MSEGLTERQEAFCRAVAEGGSAARAARMAGYAPGNARQAGHELLQKADISRRISDLRSEFAAARAAEINGMVASLRLIGDQARRNHHFGAALRAVELEARLRGLLGDRLPLPPSDPATDPAPPTAPPTTPPTAPRVAPPTAAPTTAPTTAIASKVGPAVGR